MGKKLAINPIPDFKKASGPVRAAYLMSLGAGFSLVGDVTGGVYHVFGSGLFMNILGVLAGYLMADTGLLLLRGRGLARKTAHVAAVGFAVLALVNGFGVVSGPGLSNAGSAIVAAAVAVLLIAVYNVAPVKASFRGNERSVINNPMRRKAAAKSGAGAQSGSWDQIKASMNDDQAAR